jgi:predicted nucleotidyltransferase
MELRPGITIDTQRLAGFCRAHSIRRLSVFGSVLRDDFAPKSDVDVLVEFEPGVAPGLLRLAAMELELSGLFGGRDVDIRTYEDLSRRIRDRVRAMAAPLYDAA